MSSYWRSNLAVLGMIGAVVALAPAICPAGTFPVDKGYDLFETDPSGTSFKGINFKGVPLGTFDFGSGAVGTGTTDTIIQRTANVAAAGGTTNLSVRVLQLESTMPLTKAQAATLGNPNLIGHNVFVTVDQAAQTAWQSNPTHNVMTINTNTFSTSFFDVFIDLHVDSLNGTMIGGTQQIDLSSSNNPWTNNAPPGALLIPGVNHNLNKINEDADFWPTGTLHNGPHAVTAATPEPATLTLAGIGGLIGGLGIWWRKRRRAAA